MSLPSTFSNAIIEGNTIDAGASNNGVITTSYTYSVNIQNSADARIVDNYISGIQNNTTNTYCISTALGACDIRGNYFIRGNSNISAYIRNAGSTDMIIKDNFFDGYTPDGVTNTIVSGITANTIFTSNKNQVGYSVIPLGTNNPSQFFFGSNNRAIITSSDWPPSTGTDYGVAGGAFYDHNPLLIWEDAASPSGRVLNVKVDITKSIPVGAKIISAKISVYNPSSIALDTAQVNQFSLFLTAGLSHTSSIDTKTFQSAGTLSTMIGFTANAALNINAGNEPNMRSNYQPIEIATLNFTGLGGPPSGIVTFTNTDISGNFVSGNDYNLGATLLFNYQALSQGTVGIPLIVVSPLIVTYVF